MPAEIFKTWAENRRFLIAATIVVYSAILISFVARQFNGNITGLLYIGTGVSSGKCPVTHAPGVMVRSDSGYDGQYYYYMAMDPWIQTDVHYCTDGGAYRYQRILMPFLASALSGGRVRFIPYVIVGINFMSVILGTFFILKFCDYYKVSRSFCLFYAAANGFLSGVTRCTVEPLYLCALVIGFYAYVTQDKIWKSALIFSLAALAKELALISVGGLFLFEAFKKRDLKKAAWLVLPFLAYAAWQVYIYAHFHKVSFIVGPGSRSYAMIFPFAGLASKITELLHFRQSNIGENLYELFLLLNLSMGMSIIFYQMRKFEQPFQLLALIYALLFSTFSASQGWIDPWGYNRHTLEFFLFLLLSYFIQRKKIYLAPLFLNCLAFFMTLRGLFF